MTSVNIRVIETLRPHDFEAPPVDIRNCICEHVVGNEWKMNGKRYRFDQICTAIEMPAAGHSWRMATAHRLLEGKYYRMTSLVVRPSLIYTTCLKPLARTQAIGILHLERRLWHGRSKFYEILLWAGKAKKGSQKMPSDGLSTSCNCRPVSPLNRPKPFKLILSTKIYLDIIYAHLSPLHTLHATYLLHCFHQTSLPPQSILVPLRALSSLFESYFGGCHHPSNLFC